MAVAVESSASNVTTSNSTSVTVPKPTGLAEGDLLYAVLCAENASTDSINLPSGWTNVEDKDSSSEDIYYRVAYKIADSSDASATDFTFTRNDDSGRFGGILLRVTGFASNDVVNDEISGSATVSGSTWTASGTIDPLISDSLLVFAAFRLDSGQNDFTNYSITGGTNPTWTQHEEVDVPSNSRFEVATATYGSTTQITEGEFDADTDGSGVAFIVLVDIPPQNDVTGTHTLLEKNPEMFDPDGSAGVTGTANLLEGAVSIFAPSASAVSPIWSKQAKPSATWKNESSV